MTAISDREGGIVFTRIDMKHRLLTLATLILSATLVVAALGKFYAQPLLAQVRAALVRSVDEPARVPYFFSGPPDCTFAQDCTLTGTTVPAGKRVRVTRLEGFLAGQPSSMEVSLELNQLFRPVVWFPVPLVTSPESTFWGNVISFNQEVDYYFEAGQQPILHVRNVFGVFVAAVNRLTIAGYIVELQP